MKLQKFLMPGLVAGLVAVTAAPPVSAAEKVKMMFDWIPGGWHAAWYAGRVNGCFGDQKLNVSLERGSGGVDTVAKVASALADVGMADLGTVMIGAHKNKAGVKAILPVYMDNPFGVLTLESNRIMALKDLEGRKLAAGPGDSNIQMLPYAMRLAGADFKQVKTERADFSALLGLLLRERIDAHTTFLTTAQILKSVAKRADKEVAFYHYGRDLNIYGSVIFASDKFLKDRPAVAKQLVAGAKCAYETARSDPEAAADVLLSEFPTKKRGATLASIQGGITLTFGGDTYKKHGFEWDMARVARTFQLSLTAQGAMVEGADGSQYIHRFD